MVVVVGTPPLRRIALWFAIETMRLSITGARFFLATIFFWYAWGPNEQFDTHINLVLR